MSKIKVSKNLINTTFNYNIKKPNIITPYYSTKIETFLQRDINLRKNYLPSIKVNSNFHSTLNKLVKSQSQGNMDISKDNNKPVFIETNGKREKLMIAKMALCRIKTKINDLNFNYKKLMTEKEENIKIIKEVINSNNFPEKENLVSKIQYIIGDTFKNNNKKTLITENSESYKNTLEEKNSKNEDIKMKNNRNDKTEEGNGKIKIRVSPINAVKDKNNMDEKEIKMEELNKDIINEDNDENKNNKGNNIIHPQGMIEEIKNNENMEINNIDSKNKKSFDLNQEMSNFPNLSVENMIKINSISINNSNFNNINNSIDEPMNLNEVIEEEKDEDFNQKENNNSVAFGKSVVPSKVYNKVKAQGELSKLKHRILNIQKQIRLKDEEIEEIKNKTCMKHLIFQSKVLNTKMVKLHKIKTTNNKFEKLFISNKSIQRENLKNELDYYTKKNKSFISENKSVEENYNKVRNEFEENNKTFSKLEIKNDHLKYKLNSLRLKDEKQQIFLDNLKKKINQNENIRFMLENNIKIIGEKKKEVEETKKILEDRIKECERVKGNREKKYKEIKKLERELNNKRNKHKNEVLRIQKEIKDIDKNIILIIDKYQHLTKDNKKFINMNYIYKLKTNSEFLNLLKEIEEELNRANEEKRQKRFGGLQKGGKINFFEISKIKRKVIKKEEIKLEDNPPVIKPKEYYINTDGELILKEDDKKEENIEKK